MKKIKQKYCLYCFLAIPILLFAIYAFITKKIQSKISEDLIYIDEIISQPIQHAPDPIHSSHTMPQMITIIPEVSENIRSLSDSNTDSCGEWCDIDPPKESLFGFEDPPEAGARWDLAKTQVVFSLLLNNLASIWYWVM